MAAALTVPAEAKVGQAIAVTGSGWSTNPVVLTISHPDQSHAQGAESQTPAGGNVTFSAFMFYLPSVWTVSATDGSSTVTKRVKVNTV